MSNFEHRDNNSRNNFRDDREDGINAQLFIAKGRNDGMDAVSLIDFIISETNISEQNISNVKILDAFSFFAVPHDEAGKILDYFQAKAGEGRPLVSRAKRKKPSGGGSGGFGGNRNGGGYRNDRPRREFNDRDRSERPRKDFGNRDNNGNY